MLEQQMAELPSDGIKPQPPLGFHVFGLWAVETGRTRGGAADLKHWGKVFKCQVSRAIHIELLEKMNASSFLCAPINTIVTVTNLVPG